MAKEKANKENKKNLIEDKDLREDRIKILQKHFPGVIESDDEKGVHSVNAAKLQMLLDPTAKNTKVDYDGYELNWVGKKIAFHDAYTPSRKLLRPLYEDSKNFDDTNNILIKGDNLEALKILRRNYFGKIKMIYIDPPYNTQSDEFLYKDNYAMKNQELLEMLDYSEENIEYVQNVLSAKTHSVWLTFMYPRLLLAKELLRDDGVIFISIDDNEQAQLKIICDEIFGDNLCSQFIWQTKTAPKGVPPLRNRVINHEYVLCYAYGSNFSFRGNKRDPSKFSNPDNDPRGDWTGENMKSTLSSAKKYTITDPDTGWKYTNRWAFAASTVEKMIEEKRIIFPESPTGTLRQKKFLKEYTNGHVPVTSYLPAYHTETATNKLKEVFDGNKIMNFPKPVELIQFFTKHSTSEKDIVLDFFAGSGTTAQAVMELNKEDGANRKFIMVQWAEEISHKQEDAINFMKSINKPENIFEICAERIRRAGKNIESDKNKESLKDANKSKNIENDKLDTGFRVFELIDDDAHSIYDVPMNEMDQHQLEEFKEPQAKQVDDILYTLMAADKIPLDIKVKRWDEDSLYIVANRLYVFAEFEPMEKLQEIKNSHPEVEYITLYSPNIKVDNFSLLFEDYALLIGFEKSKIRVK